MSDIEPPAPPSSELPDLPDPLANPAPGLGLLGIEIGATAVRLVLLDSEATSVTDLVERPIGSGDGSLDQSAELRLQTALLAALDAIGLSEPTPLLMGVSIGMANCGVGSGPALRDWLENLSGRLGQPFLCAGNPGVSYAPADVVSFLRRVFEPLPLHLDRIELAPVAASRVIPAMHPGAITLGSGMAWSARIVGHEVLEAYEIAGGPVDQTLTVATGADAESIEQLEGIEVDPELCRERGLTVGALAPAVGVALALRTSPPTNLLAAEPVGVTPGPAVGSRSAPTREPQPVPASPAMRSTESSGQTDVRTMPVQRWDPARAEGWDPVEQRQPPGVDAYDRYDDYQALRRSADFAPGAAAGGRRHPRDHSQADSGFRVSDFVLGALLMLAVVLTLALVFL
ncbi:MAG: hypothetical protein AAGA93_14735 [Actinomycetota bacterium]